MNDMRYAVALVAGIGVFGSCSGGGEREARHLEELCRNAVDNIEQVYAECGAEDPGYDPDQNCPASLEQESNGECWEEWYQCWGVSFSCDEGVVTQTVQEDCEPC